MRMLTVICLLAASACTNYGCPPPWARTSGVELVVELEMNEALLDRLEGRGDDLLRHAGENAIDIEGIEISDGRPELLVRLGAEAEDSFESAMGRRFSDLRIAERSAGVFTVAFSAEEEERIASEVLDRVSTILIRRIDMLGTSAEISRRDRSSLVLWIPRIRDPTPVKRLLSKSGRLEFRIADDQGSDFLRALQGDLPENVSLESERLPGPYGTEVTAWYLRSDDRRSLERVRDELRRAEAMPAKRTIAFEEVVGSSGRFHRTYLLHHRPELTGENLRDARVVVDEMRGGRPFVAIQFDPEGAKILEEITSENIMRRLVIMIDGTVNSAPVVRESISGGRASITMGIPTESQDMVREAEELVLVLRSGTLPVDIRVSDSPPAGL